MVTSSRDTYDTKSMIQLMKDKLKGIGVSDSVLELIINSYIETKRSVLLDGNIINEKGLEVVGLQVRKVPKRFSEQRFTIKLDSNIDSELRSEAINKINNDENFKEILGFVE